MEYEEKTIKGLSIEYDGETIKEINSFSINQYSTDSKNVYFSYNKDKNALVSVRCKLSDIKIITGE